MNDELRSDLAKLQVSFDVLSLPPSERAWLCSQVELMVMIAYLNGKRDHNRAVTRKLNEVFDTLPRKSFFANLFGL